MTKGRSVILLFAFLFALNCLGEMPPNPPSLSLDSVSYDNSHKLLEILWDSQVSRSVDDTYNTNQLLDYMGWGVGDRVDNTPIYRYKNNDANPFKSKWSVQIEVGRNGAESRSEGSKSVFMYTDMGFPNADKYNADRAEFHIRDSLLDIGMGEKGIKNGESLWVGWSEKWLAFDVENTTTFIQFRNQPTAERLRQFGAYDALEKGFNTGGPVCSGLLVGDQGYEPFVKFVCREGTPTEWRTREDQVSTLQPRLSLNTWYDFIVNIVYSDQSDGKLRVWMRNSKDDNYTLIWNYVGNTMYTYPSLSSGLTMPLPEVRIGIYRWGVKGKKILSGSRYASMLLGPIRFYNGINDNGFSLVSPK